MPGLGLGRDLYHAAALVGGHGLFLGGFGLLALGGQSRGGQEAQEHGEAQEQREGSLLQHVTLLLSQSAGNVPAMLATFSGVRVSMVWPLASVSLFFTWTAWAWTATVTVQPW